MKRPPDVFDSLVTRESLPIWLIEHGLTGNAVETGTFRGEFAAHWLTHWPGHLTTMDPFENDNTAEYLDGCVTGLDMDQVMQEAVDRLREWLQSGRCRLFKARSLEVAALIPDGSLAACYCDGNHAGEAVAAEIRAFWPKIQPGGLLGGHDFFTRHDSLQRADVANAVLDFAEELGVRPRVLPCSSWFFLKS